VRIIVPKRRDASSFFPREGSLDRDWRKKSLVETTAPFLSSSLFFLSVVRTPVLADAGGGNSSMRSPPFSFSSFFIAGAKPSMSGGGAFLPFFPFFRDRNGIEEESTLLKIFAAQECRRRFPPCECRREEGGCQSSPLFLFSPFFFFFFWCFLPEARFFFEHYACNR